MSEALVELGACNHAVHETPFASRKKHRHYLFRLQVEGSAHVCLNGVQYRLGGGDLLMCRPADAYELRLEPAASGPALRSADYFVYCSGEWVDWWWDEALPRVVHVGPNEQIVQAFRSIVYERRRVLEPSPEIQDCLARLLLLAIRRLMRSGARAAPRLYMPYRMKEYIEQQATQPLTLRQIAAHVGLGVSRASELFRATFGTSPMDYVITIRLHMVRERVLYDDIGLEEAAYACGFRTYTHFSRLFKARFGMTPQAFKRSNKLIRKKGSN
ncbi:helix-turn-helix transcriptional regulator [Paenibacillus sp. IB182496]|uniref:Helix-turn-helix transcriptional regulator n=1 Tax=Paenibacillus sabuli TaxID=2772509 RepID=A0A927BY86_9BACL|nr:helix-turn-helix domain-containing protein [Paenibacillus sabuli]MBD2847810.1 helix-turn-helix transcriptional regulator [Paenibacillus sabuli]